MNSINFVMETSTPSNMVIPESLSRLFQEYEFNKMAVDSHAKIIMERTLELGTWDELHWLFHHYGVQRIIAYIRRYGQRRLSKRTFSYWCQLLEINTYCHAPFAEIRDDVWST